MAWIARGGSTRRILRFLGVGVEGESGVERRAAFSADSVSSDGEDVRMRIVLVGRRVSVRSVDRGILRGLQTRIGMSASNNAPTVLWSKVRDDEDRTSVISTGMGNCERYDDDGICRCVEVPCRFLEMLVKLF